MNTLTRKKLHVVLNISDGSTIKGTVVIERTSRLSDMMNNTGKDFIVLADYNDNPHIINKRHIIQITEVSESEQNQ